MAAIGAIQPANVAVVWYNLFALATTERTVTVVTLTVLGLALSLVVDPPLVWALLAGLIVLVAVGIDQIMRAHPLMRRRSPGLAVCLLPSLLLLSGFLFLHLPVVSYGAGRALGLLMIALLLGATLGAQYRSIDPLDQHHRAAQFILSLITYTIAFALFSAIYAPKVRSILSATAIVIASALLAAELIRETGSSRRSTLLVPVVGLAMGQVTWALNYWILGPLTGGMVLLMVFYALTGVIHASIEGTLTRRVATEYGAVLTGGFAVALVGGLWLR